MNKVKIAIIDSGIDYSNLYLSKYVVGEKSFILDIDSMNITEYDKSIDEYGHGTACTYTILRRNEQVEIYPIKIINALGRTNSQCLLKALEFLVDTDIKLINVSLATTNLIFEESFYKICRELYLKGKIIISSMDNSFIKSLPSTLPFVIGVRGKNFNFTDEYWYNECKEIQCICDSMPIVVPKLGGERMQMFGHNSKATAIMTANISKLLNRNPKVTFSEINDLLSKYAVKNDWAQKDIDQVNINCNHVKKTIDYDNYKEALLDICSVISKTFEIKSNEISKLYKQPLINTDIKISERNCCDLIPAIEEKFNMKLNYDIICFNSFYSIYTILDIILKSKELIM